MDVIEQVAWGMVSGPDESGGQDAYFAVLADKVAESVEPLRRAGARGDDSRSGRTKVSPA